MSSNEDRFWSKVDRSGGADACWPWTAGRYRYGYGFFSVSAGDTRRAHRVAWEMTNGPIPDGICVLHRCDNPPCCNPTHLFLGTHADNVADKVAKGRQARGYGVGAFTHPDRVPRGAQHGRSTKPERTARGSRVGIAKLDDEKVREMRVLRQQGLTYKIIAQRFGVALPTAHAAIHRNWKHVS